MGEALLGYQAQCRRCEWASILHLDREEAIKDDDVHKKFYPHLTSIVPCESLDDIRASS